MRALNRWTYCRREGCGRMLGPRQQEAGFCNLRCVEMYGEEKDYHIKTALAEFKKEGEPNGGKDA